MFESASARHEPDTSSAPRGACYITQNLYFATLSPTRASGREDYLSSRPSPKSTRADSAYQSAHSGCSRAAHSRTRGRARRRTLCDMRSAVACDATKPLPSDHRCRQDPQSEPAFDIEADGCPVDLALRGLNCPAAPASDQRRADLDASSSGSAVTRSLSSSNTVARLAPAYVRHCTKHCAQDCPSQSGLLSDQVAEHAGSSLGFGTPTARGSLRSTNDGKARKASLPSSPPDLPSSSSLGTVDSPNSFQATYDYVTHARITATGLSDSPSSGAHGAQGHHKIWPLTSQRPASTTSAYHYNLPVHPHTSTYSPDPFLDSSPPSAYADTLFSHSTGSTQKSPRPHRHTLHRARRSSRTLDGQGAHGATSRTQDEQPLYIACASLDQHTSSSLRESPDVARPRKRRNSAEHAPAPDSPQKALERQPTARHDSPNQPPVTHASSPPPVEARLFRWIASRAPLAGHSASTYAASHSMGGDDGDSWRTSTSTPNVNVIQPEGRGGGERGGGGGGGGGKRGRRKKGDGGDDDKPKRVPRKTELACLFCRGRKLKCDGGKPTCGNCERRRQPCTYDPVIKRRGPGKKTRARAGEGQAGEAPTPEPEPEEQMAGPSGSANVVPGAHMMAFQGYPHPLPPPSALYGHHPAHQLAPGGMHAMGGMMPAGFPIGQPIVPPGVPAHVAVPAGGHGGQRYPSPLLPGDFGGPGAPRGYKRAATRSPEGKPVAKRPETEDEADWTDEDENPYDG